MIKRRLIILGATGSIGTTCLNAIRAQSLYADVVGLVGFSSIEKLQSLSKEFNCPYILNTNSTVLRDFLSSLSADIVLNGIAGAPGLEASLISLECGFDLALANKESIVMGGNFILNEAKRLGRKIIPVDSEHSAIYNLIKAHGEIDSVVITASGGPFYQKKNLENVTVEEATNHPTWKMGKKISIDSATLANKGLEVIEAGFLFNLPSSKIEVTIHRQSVVHSMVRLANGAVYAQLSPPDMTLPIVGAVNDEINPLKDVVRPLSFKDLTLTFSSWSKEEFPLLKLAYIALEKKGSYPIAFNAANEVAVGLFIDHKIKFTQIAGITEKVMKYNFSKECNSFDEIVEVDNKARTIALEGF
ncbi:MAG: 1-deoxy-D-xylulose-5-phosphate reductoisomerase [Spirochaetales bacterium]|nr:1-deoxy-D-xylulose-5-phosphate reductoisomerase [Spirochaetales bacterium]